MTSKVETDVEELEETSWYMDRIFKLAQDRRYTTAIDCWAIILDAMFAQRTYVSIDGTEIIGITAADIATVLNMHLSSVYHNLKILQSKEVDVLETVNLEGYNEKGRKITQKVFRVPEVYYTEYRRIYDGLQDVGFAPPHKEFTFFNLLKIRGILSHYAAMMNKDRVLVADETEEIKDWYTNWLNPLKLSHFNILPGVIYRFNTRDMLKILRVITELLEENKDNYQDEDAKEGELPILFSYLVFAPYTREMIDNEWLNRDEFNERIEELTGRLIPDEEETECKKDHETFFKYGLSCPVCGKSPEKI
jgi:hypothetical protein